MQKYNFHFTIQLIKWVFRGFSKKTRVQAKSELELHEAIGTQKVLIFSYIKESTGEWREAQGKEFRYNKAGNVLYHDLDSNSLRSFKPENLKTKLKIA